MDVRELPHMTTRVETGPTQFGPQDWPGVFIRGDNAFNYAGQLRAVLAALSPRHVKQMGVSYAVVSNLADLLESCIVK
jgi:hypothetical protein